MATGDPERGARLRQARTAKGLTLKEAAQACGVTESAASRWETGGSDVSCSHLKTLCVLYCVSPSWVLNLEAVA